MEDIVTYDFVQFNLARTNNIGNTLITSNLIWVLKDGEFIQEEHQFSPALLKAIDEIITNAIDAHIKKAGKVIKITFADGLISVYNDGSGIKIENDERGWTVTRCFSSEYTSSNYNDKKISIVGGLNGIGSKLTNIFSREFIIETCDGTQKFKQTFSDNLGKIGEPQVTKGKEPFTQVSFRLDYDKICKVSKTEDSKNWKNDKLVYKLIERRAYEASMYLNHKNIKIYLNDKLIYVNFDKFVSMHGGNNITYSFGKKYKFYCGIVFREPIKKSEYEPQGFKNISFMNGVALDEFSNYINTLLKKFENYFKSHRDYIKFALREVKKGFPSRLFRENIMFITSAQYPTLHFDFKGQIKSCAMFSEKSLREFDKSYEFPHGFLEKAWDKIKVIIRMLVKPKNKVLHIKPNHYVPAQVKKPNRPEWLCVVEGNSAETLMAKIISGSKYFDFKTSGIMSSGGVTMNAVKNTDFFPQGPQQNEKLQNNKFFQSLIGKRVLNLSFARDRKPWYKKLLIATDQDLDGIGKICSLIMCFFVVYFPNLVKEGFLHRLRNPLIIVRKKKEELFFYSEHEYEEYCKIHGDVKGQYNKGLGTYDGPAVKRISAEAHKNIVQITYDEAGAELMKVLYGSDTSLRKTKLLIGQSTYQYANPLCVKMSEHFNIESVAEQLNNIHRMLPNYIDGLVPCQRKVIATIKKIKSTKIKVSALGGEIQSKMNYAHGEMSINGTIMRMAQYFEGSNRFPLIKAISDSIGSINGGKSETAAPRYTDVAYSNIVDLIFPSEDDDILPRVKEEGAYYEPIEYVPIVPRVLIEDTESVATGWNSRFVAREYEYVANYVRYSIEFYPKIMCSNLFGVPSVYGRYVSTYYNREICYADWTYNKEENKIHITRLPLHVWAKKYTAHILGFEDDEDKEKKRKRKKYEDVVEDVYNNSSEEVNIIICLKENAMETINNSSTKPWLHPIEEYFLLYKSFKNNLNFFREKITEFKNINEIFVKWFTVRRALYITRLEKQKIIHDALLIYYKNKYKFLTVHSKVFENLKPEEQEILLEENGYAKINKAKILNTQICDPQELYKLIYDNATYDYIYDIKKRETSSKNIERLKNKIDELENKKQQTWQECWLSDLERFEDYVMFQN